MPSKSYLLTGASGFLGKYISHELEGKFMSLGRKPSNKIVCDLSENIPAIPQMDIVIHCAGKAHSVPKNKEEAELFLKVNYQGTLNLLKALENNPPQQFIFISTVAVYGLSEGENINESSPLLGNSPYALSKIKAEKAVEEWSKAQNVPAIILRLPLVYGFNPPGNLGAINRMIASGKYLKISKNHARKSIVLAKDVAHLLVNMTIQSGIYNLSDGYHPRFSEIENAIAEVHEINLKYSISKNWIKTIAKGGDILRYLSLPFPIYSERLNKMISTLTVDDSKARAELNWNPSSVIAHAPTINISV